jgi:hypothetical protein
VSRFSGSSCRPIRGEGKGLSADLVTDPDDTESVQEALSHVASIGELGPEGNFTLIDIAPGTYTFVLPSPEGARSMGLPIGLGAAPLLQKSIVIGTTDQTVTFTVEK